MGDVGQSTWEEVNFQPADSPGGENYGWRLMEGFHCYNPSTDCFDPSLTLPIIEHRHTFPNGECSVIGGYVYRGARFPRFDGLYFYSDYCSGRIWAAFQLDTWVNPEFLDTSMAVTTFGEDEDGELYLADDNDGMIYRLLDPQPFCDVDLNQTTYQNGDVIIATPRLVNLGDLPAAVRFQVAVIPPVGDPSLLTNRSLSLPPGTERTRAPVELVTVSPSLPRGVFALNCRFLHPTTGEILFEEVANFIVE